MECIIWTIDIYIYINLNNLHGIVGATHFTKLLVKQ